MTRSMEGDALHHLTAALAGTPTVDVPDGAGDEWWHFELERAVLACDQERLTALMVNAAIAGLTETKLKLWYELTLWHAPKEVVHFWTGPCDCHP